MNEIIDLQNKDKVISYKDYIRGIVEANTVFLRDTYLTFYEKGKCPHCGVTING